MNDRVDLLLKITAEDASKSIKNANTETTKFKKTLSSLRTDIKGAFGVANIVSWVKIIKNSVNAMVNAMEAQADYAESLNLLEVAFKDTSDEAKELIATISDKTGFDPAGLTKYLGTFRQMTSALGITSEYADTLSQNLLKMQLDLSSLYNMNLDTVGKKLQSAMAGQRTAVRAFGAEITEATLQVEAQNMGIKESVSEMTRAEKTILIYLALEKQLVNANGDVSRTINSVANQTKIFREQIAIAGRQLKSFAIAIGKTVLPVINGLLMAFNEIIGMLMTIIGVDVESLMGDFGAGDLSSGYEDLSSSIDKVTESNEKAKKSLVGWNKLNAISTPTDTSSDSGIGDINPELLSKIGDYDLHLSDIQNKATEIRDTIMQWLGFTKNANGEWEWSAKLLKENILKTIKNIWEWLKKNWKLVATIVGIIAGIKLIKKLKDVLSPMKDVSKAGEKMASAFKIIAVGATGLMILAGIGIVIAEITELIKAFSESGMTLGDVAILLGIVLGELAVAMLAFVGIAKMVDLTTLASLVVLFGGMATIIKTVTDLINAFSESGMTLGEVAGLLGIILGEVVLAMTAMAVIAKVLVSDPLVLVGLLALVTSISVVLLVVKETLPTILDALGKFIEKIAPHLDKWLGTIFKGIEKIIEALGKTLPPIVESVGNLFEKIFDGIAKVIKTVGDSMTKILTSLKDLVKTVLRELIKFIEDLGPAINTFVDNAISAITKLVNFIVSGVEFAINSTIIAGINGIISAYNGSLGEFFAWLGFEADIKKIKNVNFSRFNPQLYADGGFPEKGQMFIAREAGAELVGSIGNKTAVVNNDQIVDSVSSGVARALSGIDFDRNVNIIAKGDTEGLLDFITFKQMEKDRQFGF